MNVADLVRAMEALAPARFAAPWDNVGLLVGDPGSPLTRAMLAIDCTGAVLREAVRGECGAIVAYHPPMFDAQKRFLVGSVAYDAARAGVALYSPHTALDVAEGGTNDALADALEMADRSALRCIDEEGHGFGRIGSVPPVTMSGLIDRVKRALSVAHVLVADRWEKEVSRVAVCAGSGGDLVSDAVDAGADVLLTGELHHHDALRALAAGMSVVCVLHSASERLVLPRLQRMLGERCPGVEFACSKEDREPFAFA
jgi:dinuclear metal center YbgI/SA1388 family protein